MRAEENQTGKVCFFTKEIKKAYDNSERADAIVERLSSIIVVKIKEETNAKKTAQKAYEKFWVEVYKAYPKIKKYEVLVKLDGSILVGKKID